MVAVGGLFETLKVCKEFFKCLVKIITNCQIH